MYRLDKAGLVGFLAALCEGRQVFALEESDGQYHLVAADEWQADKHTLGAYRPVEPLKSLVFTPREFLGSFSKTVDPSSMPERVVIGVKGCDVSALRIHDYVFLDTEDSRTGEPLPYRSRHNLTATLSGWRDRVALVLEHLALLF